ncbi:hypothetical protein SY83_05305 [Paenibacillus swuensis]|uniref:ABC transporter substrate-binding protein n=1 Tax=Paenibacillus swuensis TaxID=1178515 RepID=A0A172TFJ1_9BACL|nr:sugar ABC transporter substrate-binding protein [Paenibacillus swuensis]ANE45811.1 hypothetical protein SY83_05305 [Paenibacillus swuensis]
MTTQRRGMVTMLTAFLSLTIMMAGCGNANNESGNAGNMSKATNNTSAEDTNTATKEPVTLKIFKDAKNAQDPKFLKMLEDFKTETGITVEPNIVPGDGMDVYKKIDVALTTGDTTDIVVLDNPLLAQKYSENGWLLPLNDLMSEASYDAEKIYGKYLTKIEDKLYMLPTSATKWMVVYNKKIFDDAGVPYPTGEAWTWDEYIETAKKLTNKEKGIYGSYMLDYDNYMYFQATQQGDGVRGYKEDGTSNYDDPVFKQSLQFFGDLGNKHKIQPSWLEFKTKKLAWDGFMSGKYGMQFIGTWYMGLLSNKTNYPRDWKAGMVQVPTMKAGEGNNFGVTDGNGINKNSEHPKEALQFVQFAAENYYKYMNVLPARVDLTKDDLNSMFQGISEGIGGDITPEQLNKALFDNKLNYVQEKIIGPAADEYSKIIVQEAELYLVGEKSLDDTIATIKKRADQAITEAANNN